MKISPLDRRLYSDQEPHFIGAIDLRYDVRI